MMTPIKFILCKYHPGIDIDLDLIFTLAFNNYYARVSSSKVTAHHLEHRGQRSPSMHSHLVASYPVPFRGVIVENIIYGFKNA